LYVTYRCLNLIVELICMKQDRRQKKQVLPKVIWEELRRHRSQQRIITPQSPYWLQWDAVDDKEKDDKSGDSRETV